MELTLSKKSLSSLSRKSIEAKKRFMTEGLHKHSDLIDTKEYFPTPTGCHGNCGGDCAGHCKGSCSKSCRGVFMY